MTNPTLEAQRWAYRVLRVRRTRRAGWRGLVVVALDAPELVRWLEELGICAVRVPSGMANARIASSLAADRILLTTDGAGFRDLAAAHRIGLVVLPPDLLAIPLRAAGRVSSEIATSRLWSRRRPWLLRMRMWESTLKDLPSP